LLAAQKIGANPDDCFVFEDSENGIRAGYAAGMKVIGVPDMVNFRDEVKALEFCELESLDKAIPLFEKYL
jgi:beta-phosphoglucomutase-like phosphatase (HAD superfamily)